MNKKIICLLVDSLIPSILEKGINDNVIPAFRFLYEHGSYRNDCVTVFPTMTASIDASIVTGVYPDEHKVPGLIWFDPNHQKIINYINGSKCVYKLGIGHCAQNVLFHLNERHISKEVETVFEALTKRGYRSASINLIAHRGMSKHALNMNTLLRSVTKTNKEATVSGPEILTLGAFAYPDDLKNEIPTPYAGIKHQYGINDFFATSVAKQLILSNRQPDFMMVYLPDNDHQIHVLNPKHGERPLIQVDHYIQEILNCYETWEQAIKNNIIIVFSDHGQTYIGKDKSEYNIDLDQLLQRMNVLQLGEKLQRHHEVVVCNNERMAYLYPLKGNGIDTLIRTLKKEARIDLIAWKENEHVRVLQPGSERKLCFKAGGGLQDSFGRAWTVEGKLEILDLHIQGTQISCQEYPDVLSRLYGALFSQDIPSVVITARPHYEFQTRYFPQHNHGGSHGSLHHLDSYVPFLISERFERDQLPRRLVDFKSFILQLLVNNE